MLCKIFSETESMIKSSNSKLLHRMSPHNACSGVCFANISDITQKHLVAWDGTRTNELKACITSYKRLCDIESRAQRVPE